VLALDAGQAISVAFPGGVARDVEAVGRPGVVVRGFDMGVGEFCRQFAEQRIEFRTVCGAKGEAKPWTNLGSDLGSDGGQPATCGQTLNQRIQTSFILGDMVSQARGLTGRA
jgi:hypothetical protein